MWDPGSRVKMKLAGGDQSGGDGSGGSSSSRPPDYVYNERSHGDQSNARGDGSGGSSSSRPPDYVYNERSHGDQSRDRDPRLRDRFRRWGASQEASPRRGRQGRGGGREDGGGILGRVADLLDKPYEWVTGKGASLVSRLAGKSAEKKARGENVEGFALAVAASASAFAVGAAAGVAGLVSPRAWGETVDALLHPVRTFKAIRGDPLAWAYVLGSVAGPGAALRFPVRVPRARVYELGRVLEWGARLYGEGVAVELPSGRVRGSGRLSSRVWGIYLEARGEAVPVKARLGRPKSYDTGWTRVRLGGTEVVVREGLEVGKGWGRWYHRGRASSPGKTVRASFDVTVERRGRGYVYTYKSYIEDPQTRLLERRPKVSEVVERVLESVEPRIEVYDPIVLRARVVGVAGVPRFSSEALEYSPELGSFVGEPLGSAVGESGNTTVSRASRTSLTEAAGTAGLPDSAAAAVNVGPGLLGGGGRTGFRFPVRGFPVPPPRRGQRLRRVYSEIVYPAAVFPL